MTVKGDKARFAIEYALDANPHGVWLNGTIAIWVDSQRVAAQEGSLRDYLHILEGIATLRGRCANPRLFSEPRDKAIALLDAALFSGDDGELDALAEREQWGLLFIDLGIAGWKFYAIESEDLSRLRLLAVGPEQSLEVVVPAEEAFDVFRAASGGLRELAEAHR